MEKNDKENNRDLGKYKGKEKRLKEEVKEIHSKINIFADQETLPQRKPDGNNLKSIIEYLEKKLQLPEEYERKPNEREGIQNKKQKKIKIWGNLLNQQKVSFFNVIKSEETAKI